MKLRTESESAVTPWMTSLLAAANGLAIVTVIVLSIMLLTSTPVFAQENVKIQLNDVEKDLKQAALDIEDALSEVGLDDRVEISFDDDEDRPKLGVYLDNLDFEDAYKLRYPYCFGVYVDGTVTNGNAERAGIIEGDIIMYFDGKKVLYEDHLVRLIRTKRFGETAKVVYFRDEAKDSTVVTFTQPVKKDKDMAKDQDWEWDQDDDGKKRKKKSVGHGGGGYIPYVVGGDFGDIEDLMLELGLNNSPFEGKDYGIFLHGGGGKGNVGNGWFLGGFGAGGGLQKSVNLDSLSRKINFNMGFGAFTIDKRLALFDWLTLGAGVGLGGATYRVNVLQIGDSFSWDNIGTELIDNGNNAITITKNYAIVQPRVEAMLRLTDWMRLRAEYGYLYGYSFDTGWNTIVESEDYDWGRETYELNGSPDTKLEAPTISLGLWFGF